MKKRTKAAKKKTSSPHAGPDKARAGRQMTPKDDREARARLARMKRPSTAVVTPPADPILARVVERAEELQRMIRVSLRRVRRLGPGKERDDACTFVNKLHASIFVHEHMPLARIHLLYFIDVAAQPQRFPTPIDARAEETIRSFRRIYPEEGAALAAHAVATAIACWEKQRNHFKAARVAMLAFDSSAPDWKTLRKSWGLFCTWKKSTPP